jgi:uncharacterized membrane protein (DUF4010 family)
VTDIIPGWDLPTFAQLKPLITSLAIGLLIGVERGWSLRLEPPGSRVAGFRTFGLLGLTGGIATLLPLPIAIVLLAATASLIVIGYARDSLVQHERSATTAITALMVIMLGAAAARYQIAALASAGIMMMLLSMRQSLHALLKGISAEELESIGRFALIALVVLPLMPNRGIGPYSAVNPFQIWMVVVLVCGLSFIGYAAARRASPTRGLLVTAMTGAIVSSTAVTAAFARKLASPSAAQGALVAGIAIASSTMFIRVLLLAAVLVPTALPTLAVAMIPATVVALGWATASVWRLPKATGEVPLGNPLDFGPALLLAASVGILAIALRWAESQFGHAGMGVLLTLTGIADVDAAVLAVSGMVPRILDGPTAGLLLIAPVLANTVLKAFMTLALTRNFSGAKAAAPLLASTAAALAALAVVRVIN